MDTVISFLIILVARGPRAPPESTSLPVGVLLYFARPRPCIGSRGPYVWSANKSKMASQDYASAIRQVLSFEFCIGEELCTRRLNPKITYVFVVRTWFCSQNNRVCNPYTCESYLDDDM